MPFFDWLLKYADEPVKLGAVLLTVVVTAAVLGGIAGFRRIRRGKMPDNGNGKAKGAPVDKVHDIVDKAVAKHEESCHKWLQEKLGNMGEDIEEVKESFEKYEKEAEKEKAKTGQILIAVQNIEKKVNGQ